MKTLTDLNEMNKRVLELEKMKEMNQAECEAISKRDRKNGRDIKALGWSKEYSDKVEEGVPARRELNFLNKRIMQFTKEAARA